LEAGRCRAETNGNGASSSARKVPDLLPLDGSYNQATTFSDFANWILPGRLLVGRYPFVEPSRCQSREKGERQLQQLLDAGVSTFISLQEEIPCQDEMRLSGVNGFLPYKGTVELLVTAMVGPPPQEVMIGLRNPHLDKYLPARKKDPSEAYKAYEQEYSREDLKFAHYPIVDLGVPSQVELQKILDSLEARLTGGENVYLHCWGGRGRVGTVAACLLGSMYGLSADEALQRVQRAFSTRNDNKERSPETDEQHALVKAYIKEAAKAH